MFPICDTAGRVVAFTGRTLATDEPAKYLNSPETELYHKSDILFGMHVAKDEIRVRKFTMLVEGQVDVLHAHQAGFTNTIALSGTALSEKHLALMKRYSDNLMLVLDADSAGLSATARSAALALGQGIRVKAARLPKGKDPADLISEDSSEFSKRIATAKPIVEFFLSELAERERDQHRLLRSVEGIVLPLINAMPSPMEREHFIQSTARALSLSGEAVRESLKRISSDERRVTSDEGIQNSSASTLPSTLYPLPSVAASRGQQLIAVIHAYPDTPLAKRIQTEYCRITEVGSIPSETPSESVLFKVEQMFGESPREGVADELLRAFEEAVIREAYQSAVGDLRRAEASGSASSVESAHAVCARLSARLAAFGL